MQHADLTDTAAAEAIAIAVQLAVTARDQFWEEYEVNSNRNYHNTSTVKCRNNAYI